MALLQLSTITEVMELKESVDRGMPLKRGVTVKLSFILF